MKFRALKGLYGDFGRKRPGEEFEIPDWRVPEEMEPLEAKGSVMRILPRPPRPVFKVIVKEKQ